MADVFLSYKREDQKIAREVATDLEAEGFSVFFDVRIEVGDSWDERIEAELNAAKAVVVLWSLKSRDSNWVKREAREALERGILCPALITHCKPPLEFSDLQASNIIERRVGDHAHAEWRRLCGRVEKCVGRKALAPDEEAAKRSIVARTPAPLRTASGRQLDRRALVLVSGAAIGTAIVGLGVVKPWERFASVGSPNARVSTPPPLGQQRAVNSPPQPDAEPSHQTAPGSRERRLQARSGSEQAIVAAPAPYDLAQLDAGMRRVVEAARDAETRANAAAALARVAAQEAAQSGVTAPRTGVGTSEFWAGNRYAGQWSGSAPSGVGVYTYTEHPNEGVLVRSEGAIRYEGEFEHGHPNGVGVVFYSGNRRYAGSMAAGNRSGPSVYYNSDGSKREGVWSEYGELTQHVWWDAQGRVRQ